MTHITCRLTAKNRDKLRNPTLCNRVVRCWCGCLSGARCRQLYDLHINSMIYTLFLFQIISFTKYFYVSLGNNFLLFFCGFPWATAQFAPSPSDALCQSKSSVNGCTTVGTTCIPTTTTVLRPLYRSTCVSWHLQLRMKGDFVGAKFYCSHALGDGNQRIRIRQKTLEFSSTVLSTLSL